jgi:hypothetical protein
MQLLASEQLIHRVDPVSMENRLAHTKVCLTHPQLSQSENGLTGNLSN